MKQRYVSRIREIVTAITNRLPTSASHDAHHFVQQFYEKVPLGELEHMTKERASAVGHSAFRFFKNHTPGKAEIRIFQPNLEEHGYQTHHLIVQVMNDDKPFLVDSLTNEISALGFTIHATFHPILSVERDAVGNLTRLLESGSAEGRKESFIHFEISGLPEGMSEQDLSDRLYEVLNYIELAIEDWQAMLSKSVEARQAIQTAKHYNQQDISEAQDFLDWLMHKNFVFLGYIGVDFLGEPSGQNATLDSKSLLGISRRDNIPAEINIGQQLVDVRKASRYSKVHRRVLMDVVTVKRIDAQGNVTGEHRFYGLFTSTAYYQNANDIPLVRRKIHRLLRSAGFSSSSHDGKAMVAILQFMPRDELFQISEEELFELSMGILALETRPGVKLFARVDLPRRYISTLVFVPRELFSTDVRKLITQTLENHFQASLENYETSIGESALARLHVVFRTSEATPDKLDIKAIEHEIATAIMLWSDRLKGALMERFGEQQAERLFRLYSHAFDTAYMARYPIVSTIYDIQKMEACIKHGDLEIELYHQRGEDPGMLHVKIYNIEADIALSDILPKLEHMGLRVIDEFPYVVQPAGMPCLRIRDIRMQIESAQQFSMAQAKPNFEELLLKVWHGTAEDDRLNGLIFSCNLSVGQIELLRACCKYLKQINFTYSQSAIEQCLVRYPELSGLLVQFFETRFDPEESDRERKTAIMKDKIEQALNQVETLQEDKIINSLYKLIGSMLRTNYYLRPHLPRETALSIKFNCAQVPDIPLPKPFVEIFVYSPRVEGIHLRGGKVARGGLRWSDRHEDFRTEVLGLMKAQMVKNAVIVPVGSKGGFVVKRVSPALREAFREEGITCYQFYLHALLDITDNVINGQVVPPEHVVRYDDDDPYLVVAADKGTATFSDLANSVSAAHDFWLGDAFASGGSAGYDHKEMGITARGAWVSVERHFNEMGLDPNAAPFTVVGIGDMSGDVFGNGMLSSDNIQLVAAFNHVHIFLDPAPDSRASFAERKRLFDLPRSGWMDYNPELISAGGGVFERSAKHIDLSLQTQAALGTDIARCSPDELIRLILKAPVDLLWNGGIGTYVKALSESHEEVGDRTNNHVRISGNELRARVVGEGGNLGFTQRGRIEYAKGGGRINTDAIDNSGGVDCSDHEVNIKIALKPAVAKGSITLEERNHFLESMTDDVAALVLRDNRLQTQAISIEEQFAARRLAAHSQLIRALEARNLLDRSIEYLPDETVLNERRERGEGLTRPELAVLLAYSKIALFSDVIRSSMPDEPYFATDLLRYFPAPMRERFEEEIKSHSLKREIIATVATNSMVNRAGIAFYFDILEDTMLPARDIVAAYSLARDILSMREVWGEVEQIHSAVSPQRCGEIYDTISKLLKHTTFWLLRHRSLPLNVDQIMGEFCQSAKQAMVDLETMLTPTQQGFLEQQRLGFAAHHLSPETSARLGQLPFLSHILTICTIAQEFKTTPVAAGKVYFELAEFIRFFDIVQQAAHISTDNRWDRLALQSLTHEFYDELGRLTRVALKQHSGSVTALADAREDSLGRLLSVVTDMLHRDKLSSPMLMVALQQLKLVSS